MSRRRRSPAASADPYTLPLFGRTSAAPADQPRRGRLRAWPAVVGGLALAALALPWIAPSRLLLMWNASASVAVGLYRIAPTGTLRPGDLVAARLSPRWRRLAAERHYLPDGVPLLKPVAALSGALVCAHGPHILIDGRRVAVRRAVDGGGRAMPAWRGCIRLVPDRLFLLSAGRADSFDGRYFGPTPRAALIGRARPIWLR